MVLIVRAHARQVDDGGNAHCFEERLGADAGALQDPGGTEGAGGQHDEFAGFDGVAGWRGAFGRGGGDVFDAGGLAALDDDFRDAGFEEEVQVRTFG